MYYSVMILVGNKPLFIANSHHGGRGAYVEDERKAYWTMLKHAQFELENYVKFEGAQIICKHSDGTIAVYLDL